MTTNFFFNNFTNSMEQQLIESLVVESIKIYGQDMYYLPRVNVTQDQIYREDVGSRYDKFYTVEMYIKNVEGFEGEGDFLSKFNLEIRDRVTFTISRKTFLDDIGSYENLSRPMEGDLIYFPLNEKLFQIKFVEHEAIFYQIGSLQTFDVVCELFEYSNEIFDTGIPLLDDIRNRYSTAILEYSKTEDGTVLLDENGNAMVNANYNIENYDASSDNEDLEAEADGFIDFSEVDPFSEGNV